MRYYFPIVWMILSLSVMSTAAVLRGLRIRAYTNNPVGFFWFSTNGITGAAGWFDSPRTVAEAVAASSSIILYDRDSVNTEPPWDGTNYLDVIRYATP